MTDYVTDFVEESREHITELNNWLLELERSPDNEKAIEEIFRIAHTLKGNCGAMGLTRASDLAHAIEDLLEGVRAEEIDATPELMDSVFEGVDDLETMIEEVTAHGEIRTDPTETIETLRTHVDGDEEFPSTSKAEVDALLEGLETPEDDREAYFVRLAVDTSEHEHGGALVVDALVDAFDLLGTEPSRARLEEQSCGTVDAVFATPVGSEAIAAALEGVEVLTDFEIVRVTDRFDAEQMGGAETDEDGDELTSEQAEDLSVDELLGEFEEFDDLDEAVEDVEEVDAFEDMGEAGSFDDLLSEEDLETIDDEPDEIEDGETADPTAPEDRDVTGDANAVFNELKDEVDMVGFDELQSELEELEFDEFDEEEVGMDELLGEDVNADDDEFLEDDELGLEATDDTDPEATDDAVEDVLVTEESTDDASDLFEESEAVDEPDPASADTDDSDGEAAFTFDDALEPVGESEDDTTDDGEESDDEEPEAKPEADDDVTIDDDPRNDEFGDGSVADPGFDTESTEFDLETGSTDAGFNDDGGLGSSDYGFDEQNEDTFEVSTADSLEDTTAVGDVPSADAGGFEPAESEFDPTTELEDAGFGGEDDMESPTEPAPEIGDAGETMEIPDITVPADGESLESEEESPETERIQSVRVNADQIDTLLTLVEGLVTSRVRLRNAVDSGESLRAIDQELDGLEDIASDLQDAVVDIQLVPLDTVTGRLPRVVRDIAREQEKHVDFEITGEDVEVDRTVLERIGDPLIHLIRNAVDHGIEPPETREAADKPREGSVELRAERERDRIVIEIEDDGSGLDPDRLRSEAVDADVLTEREAEELPDEDVYDLVFHPGLSTADEVTDISGRGVGMDVVKRTVEDLEGTITVESEPGEGTTVTVTVPVTVAISEVLFVRSGETVFGIPTKVIEDVASATTVSTDDDWSSVEIDEETLPVLELTETLGTEESRPNEDGMIVRIRDEVRPVAIHCEDIRDQQEVVIKPFEGIMSDIPGMSGATVRGRGKVVNILDVKTL
ncbi:chemotaxis protein CheA [Natrialbaceae archaeon A-gly3]